MKNWSWVIALMFVCSLGLFIGPGIAESRITSVPDGGGYGIALNDNGTVWLWGGMDAKDAGSHRPVIIEGIDHAVAVSVYSNTVVVLKDDGTVWLLDADSYYFKDGVLQDSWPSVKIKKVNGLSDIIAISGNSENLMALKKDGSVWMLGNNAYGQLATSDHYGDTFYPFGQTASAVQIGGLSGIKAIAMGRGHALALKSDGTVWAWGRNGDGQLGNGNVTWTTSPPITEGGITTPAIVKGLANVTAIDAGYESSMALKDDGTVWTWGRNDFGMLGAGIPENVEYRSTLPVQVDGLTNATAISAGETFDMALLDDGTVWTWGDNDNGQLGDGTTDARYYPVQAKGLRGIVSASAGWDYGFALDEYGAIWAWGSDYTGPLGDGRHGDGAYSTIAEKVPFSEALEGTSARPSWMAASRPPIRVGQPIPDNSSIEYMAAIDGTIYAFSANGLMAMDRSGVPGWNISIPGAWTYENAYGLVINPNRTTVGYVSSSAHPEPTAQVEYDTDWWRVKMVPTFATEDGHIYLYALTNASDSLYNPFDDSHGMASLSTSLSSPTMYAEKELMAVSPDGKIEWTRSFSDNIAVQDRTHIEARNGRIYLYHDYNESVFDASGNLLFTINNIADPVSVDEAGYIYAMPAVADRLAWNPASLDGKTFEYRVPSDTIEKYGPEGKLVWRKELPEKAVSSYFAPAVWNDNIGIPLYMNGLLYVPVQNGTIALNKDGVPVWTKKLDDAYNFYYLMPTDSKGDLYLYVEHSYDRYHDSNITVVGIKPDGTELGRVDIGPADAAIASEGIIYLNGASWSERYQPSNVTRDNMQNATIAAYDLKTGKYIWHFTTPLGTTNTVTINMSNVLTLFLDPETKGIPPGGIGGTQSYGQIIPSSNLTYIYFRTAVWDEPVVYNESTYTYYSALYAVDKNGRLVWQKPMGSFITAMAANNSTIYYGTSGGGLSVSTAGVVAGLAIVASVLLLFKFFLLGSVSRARSRIDKNDNRNRIYRLIVDRPGSTLYELSKEAGMNIGTLRYHLMILGLNHRIVSYNDDGKFVRYFTNSNTYSKDDQMVISLARRESIGNILKALQERGEATNVELSEELGLPDSAISKYLNILVKKGVVVKNPSPTIRASYSVDNAHRDRVSGALGLLGGGQAAISKSGSYPRAEA